MHVKPPFASSAGPTLGHIKCKYCPIYFKPTNKWQVFHSSSCRNSYHNDKKILEDLKKLVKRMDDV